MITFLLKLFTHEHLCFNCLHFTIIDGPFFPDLKCQRETQ